MLRNDECHEEQNVSEKRLKQKESSEDEAIYKKFKTGKGVLSEESRNRTLKPEEFAEEDDYFLFSDEGDNDNSAYTNKMESKGVEINFITESNHFPWTKLNSKRELDNIVPLTTIRFRNILQPSNSSNILRNVSFNLSIEGVYSSPSTLSKRSSLKRSFTSSALCIH